MDAGRRKFLIVVGAGVLVVVIIGAFLFGRRSARPVVVMTAGYAPFVIDLPENGVVQYPQIQTVSSQIAGNVGRIYVKAGDSVAEGRLLATIENPQITANAASSAAAYRTATARVESATVTGGSNVVQAEANLETARTRLAQAQQDSANGLQSGLGYGETTATEQRAQAASNLATATTNLREAQRMYAAYRELYASKAVSRDQLDQVEAKYEQAQGAYSQARLAEAALDAQLRRSKSVLEDNLRSAQEGFAQAQAQLAAARVESGSGDVAAAQGEAARAESEYAFAREQADATQIRAPYDATVLNVASEKNDPLRPLQPGDAIDVGQPLLTLAAQRGFVVRTRVDEQDVINVRLGQRARITGEDFPGRTLSGRVVEVSPIAQRSGDAPSASRTVATTVVIERPPAFLRDGMSADVDILTTDLPHAITVPNDAILHDASGTYVFVVRRDTARRQPVRVGAANETSSVVVSGLQQGDAIVVQGVGSLNDGDPVAPSTVGPPMQR
ncbi:MAG: efflux RND transporter periplasmic adaptor subunit [Candidatus Eremiobacteraeota bacterium]|nr:efflux RND transporter periplasmic adaptor subunit [Candidatus Eremiobacteraeota bacterium]